MFKMISSVILVCCVCLGAACGTNGSAGDVVGVGDGTGTDGTDADICVPDCGDRVCGDDGCGGVCGLCAGGLVCNDSGTCLTAVCETDADCEEHGLACHPGTGVCVECLAQTQCGPDSRCKEGTCQKVVECASTLDCPGELVCSDGSGHCVACSGDEDCPEGQLCGADFECYDQHPCGSDKECKEFDLICDKASGYCADCLGPLDCFDFEYCLDSYCLIDECTAKDVECHLNQVIGCNEDGSQIATLETCTDSQFCEDSQCQDQVCAPSEIWCDGAVLKQCDDIGKAIIKETDCQAEDMDCINAACQATICPPAQKFCIDDTTWASCSEDGLEYAPMLCPEQHFCNDGGCYPWVCVPASKECVNNVASNCNDKGSVLLEVNCDELEQGCQNGACKEYVCKPAESFCEDGQTVAQCTPDGFSYDTAACPGQAYCEDGECHPWACTPGQASCEGSVILVCNDSGSGPLPDSVDCAQQGGFCLEGECVDCIPSCAGKLCGDNGCGGSCGGCPVNETCVGGGCQCLTLVCADQCCPEGAACTQQGCCAPNCDGKECGADGCGSQCGVCANGDDVCVAGVCVCQPNCMGKQCGDDGCGGDCGSCGPGQICINGFCPPEGTTCEDGNQVPWDGCTNNDISEFRVDTESVINSEEPTIAALPQGGYVVAWNAMSVPSGSGTDVAFKLYLSNGKIGKPLTRANTYTTGSQQTASVVALADGNALITWESYGQDGSANGVFGQLLAGNGALSGGEFQANDYEQLDQKGPSPFALNTGFGVAWFGQTDMDDSGGGICGRLFDQQAKPAGGEFLVNSYTEYAQMEPAGAGAAGSGFMVAWESILQDGASGGVFGQRFSVQGTAAGSEFQVNTTTSNNQRGPAVAGGDTGYVVLWESNQQDGSSWGIFGQRFNLQGVKQGIEFKVNTTVSGAQEDAAVAMCSSGDFVAAWKGVATGTGTDIFAQRYAKTGVPKGSELKVNLLKTGEQSSPGVAVFSDCSFAVVWAGMPGSDAQGIYLQRFTADGERLYL